MYRRRHRWGVLLTPLLALLASCGSGPSERSDDKTQVVVIGFTASKTGKLALESDRQIKGLRLWLKHVNESGRVKLADGRTVKFVERHYDDESVKGRVQELYTRLINEDQADFLISPYSSGLTDAAAMIAEQNGKVMVTTGASSDSTFKRGLTHVYQLYTPASRYLTGAFDLLKSMDPKIKNVSIVNENERFSQDVCNNAKVYGEKEKFNILMHEGYDSTTKDFAPFINKLPEQTEALMGGGHTNDGKTLAGQVHGKGNKPKFIALLVAPTEPTFADLGNAAVGIVGPSQWESDVTFSPESAKKSGTDWYGPTVPDFVKAFESEYKGEETSYHGAGGYAAGLLLEKAISDAGSIETAKVRAALDNFNLTTFFGRTKFDTEKVRGLQIGHEMVYIQWQKKEGKEKPVKQIVWPTVAKTSDPIFASASEASAAPAPSETKGDSKTTEAPAKSAAPNRTLASIIDGLLIGCVYGVAAMGLTLIWGVMRVINLAHGAVMALGMFAMFGLAGKLGWNSYLALPLVAVGGMLVGILIYFLSVRQVINSSHLSSLLATFAVNMIVIGIGTAAFSTTPYFYDPKMGSVSFLDVPIAGSRLVAAIASLVLAIGLQQFLQRTLIGKEIRAVANNRRAASLMGINTSWTLALSFGLGTMLAAVAGGLIATSYSFTIHEGAGYQSKGFIIGVLGGLGNPIGALLGGLILGLIEGIIPLYMPISWVPVLEFGLFVLVLLVRPNGLLGAK